MIQRRVVGVVGMGNVGTAAAYAMFLSGIATEMVLVDRELARAEGEALDLAHGQSLAGPTQVRAGTWSDLREAQVIVIAAGVGQAPGETRLDLLARNVAVFESVGRELDRHAPDAVLVVATNPVDILTHCLQRSSPRPASQILGTGTMLDTARFRAAIGAHFVVSPSSVHAYVLGEHGDSEVAAWSLAQVGGVDVSSLELGGRRLDDRAMARIAQETRDAAYAIVARKGYTNLAIGVVLSRLVEMILRDEKGIVPVSVRLRGEYGLDDVCLSLPAVVGRRGVEAIVPPLLAPHEVAALRHSADVLKQSLSALPSPT